MGRDRHIIRILLLVSVLLLGLLAPMRGAAGAPDPRFGVIAAHEAPWAAADLRAGWTTVPFRWEEIQPLGPADWNPPLSDEQLALELALGRQVVGVLSGVPVWAADPVTGLPRGLKTAPDDPENLWAVFVGTVVRRYAGRIDHWVVWEGPDRPENWPGSAADFAGLLRVAWQSVRAANSRAVIHLGGVSHWPDVLQGNPPFVRRLLDALASDSRARAHHFYFDVLTLDVEGPPESLYDLPVFYRRLLAEYGLEKEIWVETGVPVSEEAEGDGLQPGEQAAFIIQAIALGISGGAERVAVYRMVDRAGEGQYGLISADGVRRPAFTAYQVAATYLGGYRSARWEQRDTVSVVVVDRGPQVTTVAWARTPTTQTLMVPAQTTRALLVNALGEAWIVHPDRGYYLLTLPGCSGDDLCRIGGAPLLLVEENGAGAAALPLPSPTAPGVTPPPPPTATPTPTPTPIPAATFTPTSSPSPTATASPTPPPTPTPASMPPATVPEPVSVLLAGALLGGLGIAGLAAGWHKGAKKQKISHKDTKAQRRTT